MSTLGLGAGGIDQLLEQLVSCPPRFDLIFEQKESGRGRKQGVDISKLT